jgi:hypothetical protein
MQPIHVLLVLLAFLAFPSLLPSWNSASSSSALVFAAKQRRPPPPPPRVIDRTDFYASLDENLHKRRFNLIVYQLPIDLASIDPSLLQVGILAVGTMGTKAGEGFGTTIPVAFRCKVTAAERIAAAEAAGS